MTIGLKLDALEQINIPKSSSGDKLSDDQYLIIDSRSSSDRSSSDNEEPRRRLFKELTVTDGIESAADEASRALEELVNDIQVIAIELFKEVPSDRNEVNTFVDRNFIQRKDIQNKTALRIADYIHEQMIKVYSKHKSKILSVFENGLNLCIPSESQNSIMGIALLFETWDLANTDFTLTDDGVHLNEQVISAPIAPKYTNTEKWVSKFNESDGKREILRPKALAILEHLRYRAWNWKGNIATLPKAEEVSNIRSALFSMFSCQDQEVQLKALEYLIELLEADPLTKESANGIVRLLNNIRSKVTIKDAEEIETEVQRPLVRAYALCLENILLQSQLGRLNGLTQSSRDEIWDRADEYLSLNIDDEDINFWAKYAVQAAQRIKTDVAEWEEWGLRLLQITNAIVQLASAINSPEASGEAIQGAQANLISAFYHLPWRKAWFEKTILIQKLSRFGLHDIQEFQEVIPLMQFEKSSLVKPQEISKKASKKAKDIYTGDNDDKLLYGIVSCLTSTIQYSPDERVQQEAMKVLIQFATIDNERVLLKVVDSLYKLISKGGRKGITSRMIIEVFHLLPSLKSDKVMATVKQIRQNFPLPPFDAQNESRYFHSVLIYFVYYVAEIKSVDVLGARSLAVSLASSEEEHVVTTFYKWIKDFIPEYQQPDAKGLTPYHVAVQQHNIGVIKHVNEVLTDININSKDYFLGHTALHDAVISEVPDAIPVLIHNGADPNIRSKEGFVPLHIAINEGAYQCIRKLLEEGADPNAITLDRETPIDLALARDEVHILTLLIEYGAEICQSPFVTPIIAAAQYGAEQCIIELLHKKQNEPLSEAEAQSILLYLHGEIEDKKADTGFQKRLLQEVEKKPLHKEVFDKVTLEVPPKDLLLKFYGLSELHHAILNREYDKFKALLIGQKNINIGDNFGNTPLHYAAWQRDPVFIEELLKFGADPKQLNAFAESPLFVFCSDRDRWIPSESHCTCHPFERNEPNPSLLKIFSEYGADFNATDQCMGNLLHRASSSGYGELALMLCKINPLLFWGNNSLGLVPFIDSLRNNRLPNWSEIIQTVSGGNLALLEKELWKVNKGQHTLANSLAYIKEVDLLSVLFKQNKKCAIRRGNTPSRKNALHVAAMVGSLEIIDLYNAHGISLTSVDAYGNNIAHIAAMYHQTHFLRKLPIDHKIFNQRNKDGKLPLHIAAATNHFEALKLLVKSKNHCLVRDAHGNTPLHLAAQSGSIEAVTFLLERNPRAIYIGNESANTPLHLACAKGYINCARELIAFEKMKNYKSNLEEEVLKDRRLEISIYEMENAWGATPFILAAQEGHLEIVNYLTSKSIGVNFRKQDFSGENALHKATFRLHLDVVKAILEIENKSISPDSGERVYDASDVRGEIPLLEISKLGAKLKEDPFSVNGIMKAHLNAEKELIQNTNEVGQSFIHNAASRGLYALLKYLAEHPQMELFAKCAKWAAPDNHGDTPLHCAVRGNHPDVIKLLLKLGVPIDKSNNKGETPIMLAVKHGDCEAARILFKEGADLKKHDKRHRTIVHHIFRKQTIPMPIPMRLLLEEILVQHPTLTTLKDKNKWTPLHTLAAFGHKDELHVLLRNLPKDEQRRLNQYVWKKTKDGETAETLANQLSPNKDMAAAITYFEERALAANGAKCTAIGRKVKSVPYNLNLRNCET
ncbi:MAG: ankyrin repeat domain-containing protein [Chlamydiota bacterium]